MEKLTRMRFRRSFSNEKRGIGSMIVLLSAMVSIIVGVGFLLVTALFIPLFLGWSTRRYVPGVSKFVAGDTLFLSVIFIMLINFSMFARFSQYFFVDQSLVLTSLISASILFIIYLLVGYLLALSVKEQLIATRINGIITMTYINNILVFVVAERFFDIETAALAAFYNIPYYVGLLVLRVKYSR
jgi:bile acid:Na+ symporter, BASS family